MVDGIRLYGEMHRFPPIYASWYGAKITELVVNHYTRRTGHSKYGLERVFKVLRDLMVVKFLESVANKPMYLFGGCDVFNLLVSGLAFLSMLYLKFCHRTSFILTLLSLIVVMVFMIAMTCILLGLSAEMMTRTFYESQGKTTYKRIKVRETRNSQKSES